MSQRIDNRAPWEKARDQALAIQELIEEDVPDWAKDKAGDFFDDIWEKCHDVAETIERTMSVTQRQQQALNNWEDGVSRWIRD